MSAPTRKSELALKMLCRYLKVHPRLVQMIPFESERDKDPMVYVDSERAGRRDTRKATNWGAMSISGACLKTWSSTQAVMALSSGLAEFYAALKGVMWDWV